MSFTSVNGDVEVTLSPLVEADLSLSTVNGAIYTDVELQFDPSGDEDGFGPGRRQRITGPLNGGGPEFERRSVNGNIFIRRGR